MPQPIYVLDLARTFPEIPHIAQSTNEAEGRPLAALTMVSAYLLSGQKLEGCMAGLTPAQIHEELDLGCRDLGTRLDFVFRWADSLRLPPEYTLTAEQLRDCIIHEVKGPGYSLRNYQRAAAAWHAARMGSVSTMGCGVGKSATGTAAAIGAVRLGNCSNKRCQIVAPYNALSTWRKFLPDLRETFEEVHLTSVDSLHHLRGLSADDGGAIIFDEVHRCKNLDSNRTTEAHRLRSRFEWCIGLTGSMLHTGCGNCLSIFDLVCPGLSRFTNPDYLGQMCDAIEYKTFRRRGRKVEVKKLGIPGEVNLEAFTEYTRRAAFSLSLDSPAVKSEVFVPKQQQVIVDSWIKPQWVLDLQTTWKARHAAENNLPVGDPILETACPFKWIPDMPDVRAAASVTLAIYEENCEELVRTVRELYGHTEVEDVAQAREIVAKMCARDKENKDLKKLAKLGGLPELASVLYCMRVEGRFDRIPEHIIVTDPKTGAKRATVRWRYAPGTTAENPGYGVKFDWLREQLEDMRERKDCFVVGCAYVETFDMACKLVEEMGITYRAIRGGVKSSDREKFIDEFQDGKVDVMVVQQVAGSESITLTRAADSVLLDHWVSPDCYTQYQARTRRVGQVRETCHYDLAFGDYQGEQVARLRRGESFDEHVRHRIETAMTDVVMQHFGAVA